VSAQLAQNPKGMTLKQLGDVLEAKELRGWRGRAGTRAHATPRQVGIAVLELRQMKMVKVDGRGERAKVVWLG